jgi:hypothetical protein
LLYPSELQPRSDRTRYFIRIKDGGRQLFLLRDIRDAANVRRRWSGKAGDAQRPSSVNVASANLATIKMPRPLRVRPEPSDQSEQKQNQEQKPEN